MKKQFYLVAISFAFVILSLLPSCKKDDNTPEENKKTEATALTQKVNTFIFDTMNDLYLWSKELPTTIDIKYETDSKAYFNKLLYKDDKWSYITDDITTWENSLQGVEKAYGYSLAFGSFVDAAGKATGNSAAKSSQPAAPPPMPKLRRSFIFACEPSWIR